MASQQEPESASARIDARIEELPEWQGALLADVRRCIHEAEPDVVEEWKWRGVPTWSRHGIICTGESYKGKVKLTFAHGAALEDPAGLFNASLGGSARRAIDLHEGEQLDKPALRELVRSAAAHNAHKASARRSDA